MAKRETLQGLRKKIDGIDAKLVKLLDVRASVVHAVGVLKRASGRVFYDPKREREVIDRAAARAKKFPEASLRNIYNEITNASLLLERPLRVAYLGPEATNAHLAAMKKYGPQAEYLSNVTLKDVFADVAAGRADFGIVPVENSTEGVVNHTLDLLLNSDLAIAGEVYIPITHNLVGRVRSLKEVKAVYSHPQALAQCRDWLEANLPQVRLCETSSTAQAASRAAREKGVVAIANPLAGRRYELRVVMPNIGGPGENITRFLVIGQEETAASGRDKTSIAFSVPERAGALFHALLPFKEAKVNMTRIESRPTKRRAWDYIFFVDLEGSMNDRKVKRALGKLREQCAYFKILGSYPREY